MVFLSYISSIDEMEPYTYVFLANIVFVLADQSIFLTFPSKLIVRTMEFTMTENLDTFVNRVAPC
jgi:hypothetical protein